MVPTAKRCRAGRGWGKPYPPSGALFFVFPDGYCIFFVFNLQAPNALFLYILRRADVLRFGRPLRTLYVAPNPTRRTPAAFHPAPAHRCPAGPPQPPGRHRTRDRRLGANVADRHVPHPPSEGHRSTSSAGKQRNTPSRNSISSGDGPSPESKPAPPPPPLRDDRLCSTITATYAARLLLSHHQGRRGKGKVCIFAREVN